MKQFPNLTVIEHPLIQHKLGVLRDVETSKKTFRALVDEIAMLMGYEVTKDLPLRPVEIDTPLERVTAHRVSGKKLTLVPILRAGLGMAEGAQRLLTDASVGHLGMFRNEDDLQPVSYYEKLPVSIASGTAVVLDPMLATGGSAMAALHLLRSRGCRDVRFACIVAAPEGVARLSAEHPDVPITAAALDRELDDRGFILPGLGDAGDRLFGTSGD